jgi:Zn-dependent protease with chaperone function
VGISVTCVSCHNTFVAKDDFGGKRGKCPKCRAVVVVPLSDAVETTYGLAPSSDEPAISQPFQKVSKKAAEKEPAPGPPDDRTEAELLQAVRDAFHGEAPRGPTAFRYRLGIGFVLVAMLLLPIVYLLLIGGIGYFVYWYATHSLAFFGSLHNVWVLLLGYVTPLVAGVILLFFMIKPLFAPLPRAGAQKVLERQEELVLFEFVSRIAQAVNAPEPQRIAVSCEVNASAGLEGGLIGLFGNRFVLTLGLPLIAGLSARQLAGVLAHELGHLAQGTGMRSNYIVRSINIWFARIVYERDGWDESLVHGCDESGRLAPIFFLAMFCIWLTRWVLWALMIIGHVLSSFLTRQMEYDADRSMARLAGSETFEEIARRLALWEVSSHLTFSLAGQWWIKDRYPDDLPMLIVANADRLPKKLHRQIQKGLNKSRTGIFDSHPCLKDRIANVGREMTDGIFHFDAPATVLLRNYPKTARQVSLKLHQAIFGRHVKRDMLVAVSELEDNV